MSLFGHKHKHERYPKDIATESPVTVTSTTTTSLPQGPQMTSMAPTAMQTVPSEGNFVEKFEKAPVFHERIRKEEVEEVQPVIHREHDRTEVHQIVQPMYQGEVTPAQYLEKQLPSEILPTVTRGVYTPSPMEANTTEFAEIERMKVEKTPIVVETEKKKIIEEVQPVIYKETVQPTIIRETKPIYEKIIEAPVIVKEIREPIKMHTLPHTQQQQALPQQSLQSPQAFPQQQMQQMHPHEVHHHGEANTGRVPIIIEKSVTVERMHSEIPKTTK